MAQKPLNQLTKTLQQLIKQSKKAGWRPSTLNTHKCKMCGRNAINFINKDKKGVTHTVIKCPKGHKAPAIIV